MPYELVRFLSTPSYFLLPFFPIQKLLPLPLSLLHKYLPIAKVTLVLLLFPALAWLLPGRTDSKHYDVFVTSASLEIAAVVVTALGTS